MSGSSHPFLRCTPITSQELPEERHSAMVANGGIASNSSHLLPVRPSARCAFIDLDGQLGGYSTYALIGKISIICVGI